MSKRAAAEAGKPAGAAVAAEGDGAEAEGELEAEAEGEGEAEGEAEADGKRKKKKKKKKKSSVLQLLNISVGSSYAAAEPPAAAAATAAHAAAAATEVQAQTETASGQTQPPPAEQHALMAVHRSPGLLAQGRRPRKPEARPSDEQMTMRDLIYFNPLNPLPEPPRSTTTTAVSYVSAKKRPTRPADADQGESDTENQGDEAESRTAAVQVHIVNGTLQLDPRSLEKTAARRSPSPSAAAAILRPEGPITYSSFSRREKVRAWTPEETEKFYTALQMVGTNFYMMNKAFPDRSHRQLKNKYHREFRSDPAKINGLLIEENRLDIDEEFLSTPVNIAGAEAASAAAAESASASEDEPAPSSWAKRKAAGKHRQATPAAGQAASTDRADPSVESAAVDDAAAAAAAATAAAPSRRQAGKRNATSSAPAKRKAGRSKTSSTPALNGDASAAAHVDANDAPVVPTEEERRALQAIANQIAHDDAPAEPSAPKPKKARKKGASATSVSASETASDTVSAGRRQSSRPQRSRVVKSYAESDGELSTDEAAGASAADGTSAAEPNNNSQKAGSARRRATARKAGANGGSREGAHGLADVEAAQFLASLSRTADADDDSAEAAEGAEAAEAADT